MPHLLSASHAAGPAKLDSVSPDLDVIIVGAGVAGLAALSYLDQAGLNAVCLEARDRIGGRILTIHDPISPIPIELGAEFVHGRPPEIWNIADATGMTVYDCRERALHVKGSEIRDRKDAWLMVDEVLQDMQQAARSGPDQSFSSFLKASSHSADAKQVAKSYVEGFNAADANVIGIASLAEDANAAEKIGGDRAFRILDGYDLIPLHLFRSVESPSSKLHLNSIVENIRWQTGSVSVRVRSGVTGHIDQVNGRRAIVTVPLGVLQSDPGTSSAIRFDPEPADILDAAARLRFGQVVRLVLRFRERVWEQRAEFTDAGFLLSDASVFPTWWTPLPIRTPIITGWSSGPKAEPLLHEDRPTVVARAIQQLSEILGIAEERLRSLVDNFYIHDWHHDPFARGAYSYLPTNALIARRTLAQPLSDTLYFAGEAINTEGHGATVHGAIASGRRAAQEIIRAARRAPGPLRQDP
jgi:monoamine oxidase